jgi:hypothetical protein
MDHLKGLRSVAQFCQRLGILGGVFWVINALFFFVEWFKNMSLPDVRGIISGYGGALIATIIPIVLIYAVGGVINLLISIEENTRK